MSSRYSTSHKGEVQEGRIAKPMRRVMVGHDATSSKDRVLRAAAEMTVDLSKLGTISGKKYGEQLDEPVCVCGFEKALFPWKIYRLWRPGSSGDGLH